MGYTGRRSRPNHAATDDNRDTTSEADPGDRADADERWDRDFDDWDGTPAAAWDTRDPAGADAGPGVGWDDGLGEPEPGYPGWSEADERYGNDEPPPARRGRGLLGGR